MDDHVRVLEPLTPTEPGSALSDTVGAGGGGGEPLTMTDTERCVLPPAPVQLSV